MALRPLEKRTGRKRPVNEQERTRQGKQQQKADWHRRNPGSKWNS